MDNSRSDSDRGCYGKTGGTGPFPLILSLKTVTMQVMKNTDNLVIGILAHVDAGKTTLCEAMLYLSGKLKKPGRVDLRDSYLDTHSLERARGITIFSKQARMEYIGRNITLLDTPGHVDFSAEAERSLQVLDIAVLVISGTDGVQAHTETLWRLLEHYEVPCFIFVTKMDLPNRGRETLVKELQARLSQNCVDFGQEETARLENIALCDEDAMEWYLAGKLGTEETTDMISRRAIFPCFFGSGLRTEGVDEFLRALTLLAPRKKCGSEQGAKVYKISRDTQGNRLTWLRITGGSLRVRSPLRYRDVSGEKLEEKITQLRLYSGDKYETAEELPAGTVCAVLGLSRTRPGQGLGAAEDSAAPCLEPVMSYRLILPEGEDPMRLLPKLLQLDQEDPQLHVVWNESLREISVQLMGKVQAEVFRQLVLDRFDVNLRLDKGRVLYRETIVKTVEGIGHFEPLRHYAEVHLLLEPMPSGSGISFDSICPEDTLDRNWQRLILTHLAEKEHRGVLTGSPITDIRITLAAGKAHLKHTEGGDFRQATYRAVRQGLMQAENVLLEPWYAFLLEVPTGEIGRAISDVRAMNGEFSSPQENGDFMRLRGSAPAAKLVSYMEELMAWSHGRGRLNLSPCGYRPCAEAERVIKETGYEPERDIENPSDSVFCAHGAGMNVHWDEVPQYMHLESCLNPRQETESDKAAVIRRNLSIDERELESIMEREFGPIKRPKYNARQINEAEQPTVETAHGPETVIIDGYNLIFAWEELRNLAVERLDLARERLINLLSGYAGFTEKQVVLVYDGFRTPGNTGSRSELHRVKVVFTEEGETGDAYIERIVNEIGRNERVRVVTNDNMIRLSALRAGVLRCNTKEFTAELERIIDQIGKILSESNKKAHKTRLADGKK